MGIVTEQRNVRPDIAENLDNVDRDDDGVLTAKSFGLGLTADALFLHFVDNEGATFAKYIADLGVIQPLIDCLVKLRDFKTGTATH